MPASIFCWLAFYYFLKQGRERDHTIIVVLFATLAVVTKLSVLMIMLLPVYMLWKKITARSYRTFAEGLVIILVTTGPWLARNYINSGYLVFPAAFTAKFANPDWKVPEEKAKALDRTITAWAHVPAMPAEEVLAMPLSEWVPLWFNITAVVMPYDKVLIFLFLAAFLFWLLQRIIKRNFDEHIDLAVIVATAGIIFWFLKAPDFRFVYGYLLPGIVLCLLPALTFLAERISGLLSFQKVLVGAILVLMGLTTFFYARVFIKDAPLAEFLLKPQTYPQAEAMQTVKLQNQNIHIIFDADCQRWAAPLPAICDINILENIQLRGRTLNNGFRTRSTH